MRDLENFMLTVDAFGTDPIPTNFNQVKEIWDDTVRDHVSVFGFDPWDLERFTEYMWDFMCRTRTLAGVRLKFQEDEPCGYYHIELGGEGYV